VTDNKMETDADMAEIAKALARESYVQRETSIESDRGAAIVAAALLETQLETAIKKLLRDLALKKGVSLFDRLFKGYGPLATSGAKIDMAYALESIDEESYHDLHVIRAIRNDFAHDAETDIPNQGMSFRVRSVSDRCANLRMISTFLHMVKTAPDPRAEEMHDGCVKALSLDTARGKYLFACYMIGRLAKPRVIQDRRESPRPERPDTTPDDTRPTGHSTDPVGLGE
jgi:DNA-binding MltR family transcriptional regulator